MYPMRKPVAKDRPAWAMTSGPEGPDWPTMVEGIRQNSSPAALEFKEGYRRGVSVFLRRQLGAVGLTQLVEETLDGALREMQSGRVVTPGDLVHFLRNVLERELLIRNLNPARGLVALAAATDHGRLHREADRIQEAMSAFSAAEQQALRRYYDGELTLAQAAASAGMSEGNFSSLREQLYEAVRVAGLRRQPPAMETAAKPAARAMAAGSGGS
jgi:DNA-directed RNA polymerase specialized sigma24 family protein